MKKHIKYMVCTLGVDFLHVLDSWILSTSFLVSAIDSSALPSLSISARVNLCIFGIAPSNFIEVILFWHENYTQGCKPEKTTDENVSYLHRQKTKIFLRDAAYRIQYIYATLQCFLLKPEFFDWVQERNASLSIIILVTNLV